MNTPSVVPMSPPAASEPHTSRTERARPKAVEHSAFVPLLLGGLALLVVLGYQTYVLVVERDALNATHTGQQQTVDNAGKLRNSLDALAADTQRLADIGNPNAGLLVAELRKRGISINPQAATGAAGVAGVAGAEGAKANAGAASATR